MRTPRTLARAGKRMSLMKDKNRELKDLLDRNEVGEEEAPEAENAERQSRETMWYGSWRAEEARSEEDPETETPEVDEDAHGPFTLGEIGADEGEPEGDETPPDNVPRRGRGLNRYVKISVNTLNKIIVVLCVALVICMIIGLSGRGYLITFDSQGGTAVESVKYLYGDLIEAPEEPYREGYTFTGWYKFADGEEEWDMETDEVTEPMTLYAGWEENGG